MSRRARARARLAQVQPTCKRVVLHTDGKSVRSAWIQWWTFLAKADPAALTRLAVSALLKRSGHVIDLYNGALEDLWRSWHQIADPIVAGALRLTAESGVRRGCRYPSLSRSGEAGSELEILS